MTNVLSFIATNMRQCTSNKSLLEYRISNIAQIIKTREACFTAELKSKISKTNKKFDKTKNRLRNI